MGSRTCAIIAIAIVVSSISGCGAVRPDSGATNWWLWQSRPAESPPDPQEQYGLSVGPTRPQLKWRHADQFNFSHPRVEGFVNRFQTDLRDFYGHALERSGRYVSRISPILKKEGVPEEFAYLPLVESGFQNHAVSPAHAVGLWQFIPGTGRRYGLRIDNFVDERRDPVKATHAAARYLKDLYGMFGDWHLSLAAYNTGERHISRIIEQGHADDYWQMSDRGYLYRETEDYVPEFLAALQIADAPEAYGFDVPMHDPLQYESVHVPRPCPLTKVAELCGTSTDLIRELNPALHRGVVPPSGYAVRVPKGMKETFQTAYSGLSSRDLLEIERSMQPRRSGVKHCHRRHGRLVCKVVGKAVARGKSGHTAGRHTTAHRKGTVSVRIAKRGAPTIFAARGKQRSRIAD